MNRASTSSSSSPVSYGPALILLITIVLILLTGPGLVRQIAHARTSEEIRLVRNELRGNASLAELSEAFIQVAQVVEPSVVHIRVSARQPRSRSGRTFPWDQFFGPHQQDPRLEQPQRPQQRPGEGGDYSEFDPSIPTGNGSGWVYDTAGHIITNNHVIAQADEITVRFSDGTERIATVVGVDPNTDIAVIKVDAPDLHPAAIATESVRQGEIVFAFGSPLRFDFSMTQGIVSAKGRRLGLTGISGYENFIQTDAAINPGNSGGPLTNIYGQVVGMNTAIASRTGVNSGLGFAIPAEMVVEVSDSLIRDGKVRRGYLGIFIEDLTPEMAQTFGYQGTGVLVVDPIKGSPSEKAGLTAGDIITHINGDPVDAAERLRMRIASFPPNTKVQVQVFRAGENIELEVVLGELSSDTQAAAGRPGGQPESHRDPAAFEATWEALRRLGIEHMETFTPELASQMRTEPLPGVLLTRVRSGSIAATRGLAPGSVITQIQGQNVDTVQSLLERLESVGTQSPIRLRVGRWDGQERAFIPRFVVVELPATE